MKRFPFDRQLLQFTMTATVPTKILTMEVDRNLDSLCRVKDLSEYTVDEKVGQRSFSSKPCPHYGILMAIERAPGMLGTSREDVRPCVFTTGLGPLWASPGVHLCGCGEVKTALHAALLGISNVHGAQLLSRRDVRKESAPAQPLEADVLGPISRTFLLFFSTQWIIMLGGSSK